MSKQKEIREGAIVSLMNYKGFHRAPCEYIVDHLAKYYDSQGIVIKVDRELPEWLKFKWANNPCITTQDAIDKHFTFDIVEDAGLVSVEPLIEKK